MNCETARSGDCGRGLSAIDSAGQIAAPIGRISKCTGQIDCPQTVRMEAWREHSIYSSEARKSVNSEAGK